jgi:hypothetical protein
MIITFSMGWAWPVFAQESPTNAEPTPSTTNVEVMSPTSEEPVSSGETMMSETGNVTEFTVNRAYTIQSGDTLSEICNVLLDDAWYWPKLWSLNQYIKNPHFIYPGNQLVFTPGTDSTFPNLELVESEEMGELAAQDPVLEAPTLPEPTENNFEDPFENAIIESSVSQGTGLSVRLKNIHVLSTKGNEPVGKITHSGEPKKLLIFGDRVYLDFYGNAYAKNVKVGDKFHAIEDVEKVRNMGASRRKLGTLVRKKAVLEVTDILQNPRRSRRKIYVARVIDSEYSVSREDQIIEYQPEVRSLVPHYTEELIDGHIVAADNQQFLIENNDYVFLNLGTNQGISEGVQLYVVRRGDGYIDDNDKDLPDVPFARVMVVEAWDNTSAAYVVTLRGALEKGDRVTTQVEK